MNYIFVDFEMETIDRIHKAERKISRMEIIEIGAVMINDSYDEISSFKRYVKPQYSEHISNAITDLTGISDETLKGAGRFEDEITEFASWCCSQGNDFKVFAWSENDLKQITKELRLKNVAPDDNMQMVLDNWGDLQLEFDQSLCSYRHTSLSHALESLGVAFEGHMHDALDDSRNTARLYVEMRTSDDYKKDVAFIKNCFYDEKKGTGITLGDLIDFSKFTFDFSS